MIGAPTYPGADVMTWAAAPPRCPLDGGPWRRVPDGLRCVTCKGRVIVAEAVARLSPRAPWTGEYPVRLGSGRRLPRRP